MKIYTKTGDQGETGLIGGVRVSKDHARIQAYGALDELNAGLGFALSHPAGVPEPLRGQLSRVQSELFHLGAELATPQGQAPRATMVDAAAIQDLEKEIDRMEQDLTPLRSFILPGGHPSAAALHLARTVCRRAEREAVSLSHAESLRPQVVQYLNRLGDYLFVAARWVNHKHQTAETPWNPKK